MTQHTLAEQLYQNRKMQTTEEVKHFEEALAALYASKDPSVLKSMFAAFDDTTEQPEVMWGLVHAVEAYDPETRLHDMALAIPTMLLQAKEWTQVLHYRVLNSDRSRSIYKQIIAALPEKIRDIIRNELEEIGTSEPEFRDRVQDLLSV